MHAVIRGIDYFLPPTVITNHHMAFPAARSAASMSEKTGVESWRAAAEHECSSDLGIRAAQRLFERYDLDPAKVDFLLFCTQTPDHLIPSSACLMHAQLGLPPHAGALDYNLGCSGYIYGLALAKGLIESSQAKKVLLVTADTHSKLVDSQEGIPIQGYGDGAAATLIETSTDHELYPGIGSFVFGTDGTAAGQMIASKSGFRGRGRSPDKSGNAEDIKVQLDGIGLFESSMRVVPQLIHDVLARSGLTIQDIETVVFYQAGKCALELLRRRAGIPSRKVYLSMKDCGNVSSSNIPIALKRASDEGVLKRHDRILLAGFGSGISWAGTVLRWTAKTGSRTDQEKTVLRSLQEEGTYAGN